MNDQYEILQDEILVLQSQQGQTDAFEELVRRWQKRLWTRAFYVTKDEEASWDIVQNTWQRAIRSMSRLRDAAAFPGWILRIANNLAIDWIRKERKQRDAHESYAETVKEKQLFNHAKWDMIHAALNRLSPVDSEILTFLHLDGFKVSAIAKILDIPTGTVKSRLHYARERLKNIMEE